MDFINYKNIKIGFSCKGKGNAIVFLHGFLENSNMWDDIKQVFLPHYKIITIDLLGHGTSECLGYIHSMEDNAEIIKAVLKHLKIRRITLIGHSMGGYIALAFAEKYPKNVKKLCLINATSQADTKKRKELRLRAIEMAKTNYNSLVSMSIANLFSAEVRDLFTDEIKTIQQQALQTSVQAYIACSEGMRLRPNREKVLLTDDYQKLMIIGKKDTILNNENLKKEALRTNTRFIEFSNGHMSYIENKKELITTLKGFVK